MRRAPRILVVDDDPNVHMTLKPWLEREGYEVQSAYTGQEALDSVTISQPDLVILDVMLPGMDGVAVCLELNRLHPSIPILMLSARDDLTDRVVGLESGADDYVTKPYHAREVVTRVRALLRRIRRVTDALQESEQVLIRGALRIEPEAYRAYIDDRALTLTTTEFELLFALAERPDLVLDRQALLDRVWGQDFFGSERTVDSHIRNLRKKINEVSPAFDPIESVRGVGYRLRV